MQIYITLDYEVFFGTKTGSVDKCLLNPTNRLLELAEKYNAKLTFFVDVLYVMKLKELSYIEKLKREYTSIRNQLTEIVDRGHDLQLHLHPHWIRASYDSKWNLDIAKYRLHSFSDIEIDEIVECSIGFLEDIAGRKVFAFRAGGWCIQPFEKLKEPLKKYGIKLDSTIFYKGYNESKNNLYDFRKSPDLDFWNFSSDPLAIDEKGEMSELPISSCSVSPLYFYKSRFLATLFPDSHSYGDGKPLKKTIKHLFRLLLSRTHRVVSIDGYKASILESAFDKHASLGKKHFVIIGHPKLLSSYSFEKLERFLQCKSLQGHRFMSIYESFGNRTAIQY